MYEYDGNDVSMRKVINQPQTMAQILERCSWDGLNVTPGVPCIDFIERTDTVHTSTRRYVKKQCHTYP